MSDLISRGKLLGVIEPMVGMWDEGTFWIDYKRVIDIIKNEPSAEPVQKKGKWIKVGHWGRSYKCNQCGNYLDFDGVNAGRGDANFCPNCGARMTKG